MVRSDVSESSVSQGTARRVISWRRLVQALVPGCLATAGCAAVSSPALALLVGWLVTAASLLIQVWRASWPQDAEGTKRLAEEEGRTHVTDTVVLLASGTSLVTVGLAVARSNQQSGTGAATSLLAVLGAILSWGLVNTVFALKYARLYYSGQDGGIDFKQQEPPSYSDFAYTAFTVGMSFAVSETEPTSTEVRRVALGHALLSYLFGTGVIGVAISLITNLGQS
jgi:uncharacterized membrane protein